MSDIIPVIREIPKTTQEWSLIFKRINEVIDYTPSGVVITIADGSVTLSKLQNITPDRLLGRDSSPAGTAEELTVSGGLEFTGSGIRRSALTGDVAAGAGSNTTTIQPGVVTYAKIQDVTPDRLLGRDTSPAGPVQELTVSGGIEFTGSGIQRSALTGDITATAGSNTTAIPVNTVTYAKIQDVSATDKLLGRSTAGAGDIEEITCTAAGRALLDDADASAQRTTLGLGTAATQNTGTTGAVVPLLDGTNVHASGQFTAFGVGTVATQQAANPDTSGAVLADLETEVNQLKAVLRTFGLIAT